MLFWWAPCDIQEVTLHSIFVFSIYSSRHVQATTALLWKALFFMELTYSLLLPKLKGLSTSRSRVEYQIHGQVGTAPAIHYDPAEIHG